MRVVRAGLGGAVVTVTLWFGPPLRPQVPTGLPADVAAIAETLGASAAEAREVAGVYRGRATGLLWSTPGGIPTDLAASMVARFDAAATHGLDPAAYRTDGVSGRVNPAGDDGIIARDVALTLATLRYMRHLHLGRVDPRRLGLRLQAWAEPHDFPRLLADGLATGRLPDLVDGLAPPYAVYGALSAALVRYRARAGDVTPAVPSVEKTVRPGDVWPGIAAVARRLILFGDLDASAAPPPDSTTYAEPLVSAVRRFQARHGLTSDGALGARTIAALQVPVAVRVQQIALALERLRWLPDLGTRRLIAVNIPMFRLWAWEAGRLEAPPVAAMDVIVGRALRTETPVFVETLDHVIFRPYWNVPNSIVRGEVLPALSRRPGYLAAQQMDIVRGPGDEAAVVPETPAALTALAAGALRLRQRPGPHNALGLVKFVFPNRESVYMHGTPSHVLFARDRRDFSHGCIRVADPPALAAWALTGLPEWTPARIAGAMAAAAPERVAVAAPIDVVLFYMTASVGPDDGLLHFADDIYGHDRELARAIRTP